MNRRLRRIALVLALTAVPAFGATPARAANGMEIAIQDDPVFVDQDYLGMTRAVALAKELRVTWIKANVSWAGVVGRSVANRRTKPSSVRYDFTPYDRLVAAARTAGINVHLSLTGQAPRWATGDKRRVGPYKPNATQFREFASAAATHFKGLVPRYSIWNEPNYVGWIAPLKGSGRVYRSLYVAGYSAIKSADPNAQVLIGETSPYALRKRATAPLAFLREVTRSGSLEADGYAHHPYDFDHKPTFKYPGRDNVTLSGLSKLTRVLNSLASSGRLSAPDGDALDLYLTEYGYFRSGKRKTPEATRARYVRQGFDIALKNSRVRQMLHYLLAQPTRRYQFFDTSITSRSGGKTATFRSLADWASDNASRLAG